MSVIQTGTSMRANLKEGRQMGKESTTGALEKSMMVNGNMELKKETVFGRELMAIPILENGKTQKHMAMEFIHGKMGIGMKVNGTTA